MKLACLSLTAALAFGGGVTVRARLGDRVETGQALADLELGDRAVDVDSLARRVAGAFELADRPFEPGNLVLGTVEEVPPECA